MVETAIRDLRSLTPVLEYMEGELYVEFRIAKLSECRSSSLRETTTFPLPFDANDSDKILTVSNNIIRPLLTYQISLYNIHTIMSSF